MPSSRASFSPWIIYLRGDALGAIAKKKLRKHPKNFCLICFLYCVGLFQWFIWSKRDIKRNLNFSRRKNDLNDFNDLLLPYFSSCKDKRIKQETNSTASKMKLFMTLVNGLFGKQLNNITKNCRCCRGPRSTSLFSILKKRVWFIHLFRTSCSRVYGRVRVHA